jgi:hypothetical protein
MILVKTAHPCLRVGRHSDEAVPAAAPRKQSVTSDDRGNSGLPQLKASLAGINMSLFDNIHMNQQKIEEAQCQIKKS